MDINGTKKKICGLKFKNGFVAQLVRAAVSKTEDAGSNPVIASMNTGLTPLGILDGIPIKPCVGSGFCCTKAPCGYGEMKEDKSGCKFLLPPNDIGQKACGKYDWIKDNVPDWEIYPAFGGGCCMTMFNEPRQKIILKLNELRLSKK